MGRIEKTVFIKRKCYNVFILHLEFPCLSSFA